MRPDAGKLMRQIVHPGPVAGERLAAVPCRVRPLRLKLQPLAGETVLATLARAFADAGYAAGYACLEDVAMARMNYVIPAASPDDSHAAWYSATHEGGPGSRISRAGLHLGRRDGAPFFHCHGIWTPAGRSEAMGHLLPFEAELAGPVEVDVLAISGAHLVTLVVETDRPGALAARLRERPGVEQVEPFGATLHVTGSDKAALMAALEAENVTARPAETSLEDVFIRLMDQAEDNMR